MYLVVCLLEPMESFFPLRNPRLLWSLVLMSAAMFRNQTAQKNVQ